MIAFDAPLAFRCEKCRSLEVEELPALHGGHLQYSRTRLSPW